MEQSERRQRRQRESLLGNIIFLTKQILLRYREALLSGSSDELRLISEVITSTFIERPTQTELLDSTIVLLQYVEKEAIEFLRFPVLASSMQIGQGYDLSLIHISEPTRPY